MMLNLGDLLFIPYLTAAGTIDHQYQGKIGVYAIFDQAQILQYVGYSRDLAASLLQHLVRQPQACWWLKLHMIDRPQRELLENLRRAWLEENGAVPPGNGEAQPLWCQPIDVRPYLTATEQISLHQGDDLAQAKLLKAVARRVEAERQAELKARGLTQEIRFQPKLKEQGLLDVK
jgi:hypothetical protein